MGLDSSQPAGNYGWRHAHKTNNAKRIENAFHMDTISLFSGYTTMKNYAVRLRMTAILAGMCLSPLVFATDTPPLKIIAKPGKPVCQSDSIPVGDATKKAELCVVGGSFSHDTYIFRIDDRQILKGIDDETTKGLKSTYAGEPLILLCAPLHESPKEVPAASVDAYQKAMKVTAEEAKRMAILAATVETGRLCQATLDKTLLLQVQVVFE